MILVIDTASNRGLAGLVDGDALIAERAWLLATTYSQELLAEIDALLLGAGVDREALSGIAVNVGPGGYGSLRVGVATAQGLALGLDIPLAGVGRLEADSVRHLEGGSSMVVAVHQAGAAGLAWATYGAAKAAGKAVAAPLEISVPRLGTVEECVAVAPDAALWCGDVTPELRAALEVRGQRAGLRWTETTAEQNMRRAVDLARLAGAHAAFGDPADVDVFYLRPPSITRPRE